MPGINPETASATPAGRRQEVVGNLLQGSGLKAEQLDAARRAQIINNASNMIAQAFGPEGAVHLRVLLAAALKAPPEVISDLFGGSGLKSEEVDWGKQAETLQIITAASNGLARGALGPGQTLNLRVLIATALQGVEDPDLLDGLLRGGRIRPDQQDAASLRKIIGSASELLGRGRLGPKGTLDIRVLIGAAIKTALSG